MTKDLRAHPFTDTILREMAINFPRGTFTTFRHLRSLADSRRFE